MAFHKKCSDGYLDETTEEETDSSTNDRSKAHVSTVPYREKVRTWLTGVSYANVDTNLSTTTNTDSSSATAEEVIIHEKEEEPEADLVVSVSACSVSRIGMVHQEADRNKFTKLLQGISGFGFGDFEARPTPAIKNRDRQGLLKNGAQLLGTISDLKICPYVESHEVSESRFRQHVLKCRLANPERASGFVICQYNASHHIPVEMYTEHLQTCWEYKEAVARHTLCLPTPKPSEGIQKQK